MKLLFEMRIQLLVGTIIIHAVPHKYKSFIGLQKAGLSTNTKKINPLSFQRTSFWIYAFYLCAVNGTCPSLIAPAQSVLNNFGLTLSSEFAVLMVLGRSIKKAAFGQETLPVTTSFFL
jgi:hypothetical protein